MRQDEPIERLKKLALVPIFIRDKGVRDYVGLWQEMKKWTRERAPLTEDECWLVSHPPVLTLGQAGKRKHLLENPISVPVVQSDRGGQITYHGPGQLLFYLLLDVQRRRLGVKDLIWAAEEVIIRLLARLHLLGYRRARMPGVFVSGAKIAALGFRIHKGCCYHGVSFNHEPELGAFDWINPCGYEDLAVTSLVNEGVNISAARVQHLFLNEMEKTLCYNIKRQKESYE